MRYRSVNPKTGASWLIQVAARCDLWKAMILFILTAVLLLTSYEPIFGLENSWRIIETRENISVSQRVEPEHRFPIFKGEGSIHATVYEVLAVILDANTHSQWMHDCTGSAKLKAVNDFEMLVYNRTAAPWPVKDRDAILRGTLEIVVPGREIISRF